MVQSLNTKIDLVMDATSFMGLADYGQLMVGDQGFEFYDSRDPRKFIQIPWQEIDYVIATVVFKGKWIPRFTIETKQNGTFNFSSKQTKTVLRSMRPYVDHSHMIKAPNFFQVLKNGLLGYTKNS